MNKVLFEDAYYVVSLLKCGIVVQSKRGDKGRCLPPTHPQYQGYLDGFEGNGYRDEKQALARSLYRS